MKKPLLFLIFLVISPGNLSAQEKYFHELRGLEDSTGTTHLFYRMYENKTYTCNVDGSQFENFDRSDNIYHFNTETESDSVLLRDYFSPWCISDIIDSHNVSAYTFIDNAPEKWVTLSNSGYCGSWLVDFRSNYFYPPEGPCAIKEAVSHKTYEPSNTSLIYHKSGDSVYVHFSGLDSELKRIGIYTLGISVSGDSLSGPNIEDYNSMEEYAEYVNSISIHRKIVAFHPTIDSISFAMDEDYLLSVSSDYYKSFSPLDSSYIYDYPVFDADSSVVYTFASQVSGQVIIQRMIASHDFGKPGTWTELTYPEDAKTIKKIIPDPTIQGRIYVYDHNSIFQSDDYGLSWETVFESDIEFQSAYIKPGGEVGYLLNKEYLFEVDLSTQHMTIVKSLPVSSEREAKIPSSITLHQNYPNPFNPSTVIRFELSDSRKVSLTVFDALGREVAVLVDEVRSAGNHEVTFNASNLPSGIYFYQLKTGDFSQTKRLTLIK